MPSEKIQDITTPGFRLEVNWGRVGEEGSIDGFQIASVNEHSPFVHPAEDGGPLGEIPPQPHTGWYITLDERGIDRLIKALHKAKRQAFGANA